MVKSRACAAPECEKAAGGKDKYCPMHRARLHRNGTLDYVGRRGTPIKEAVESRLVRRPGQCWLWTGYHDALGYPKLRRSEQNLAVHRWIFANYVAPLDDELVIDHACGNTGCVNPEHLRQISQQGNTEHFTAPLKSNNTSGYRGVSFHKPSRLWMARVKARGVERTTYHSTVEAAAEAAQKMRLELHTYNDLDR